MAGQTQKPAATQPRWHTDSGFSIRFETTNNEPVGPVWQVHIRHHGSGEEVVLPGIDTVAWASWITERVNLPYPRKLDPIGEKTMTTEAVEMNVFKERLYDLYRQDMASDGAAVASRAARTPIAETIEMADGGPHTPVAYEAHGGGFIEHEPSAYGARGAPQNENHLEVETAAALTSSNQESFIEAVAGVGEELLLDAWHAEFNTASTVTLMRQQPVTEALMEALEVIIGPDDRQQVTNGLTEEYPWRCICSLRIVANDGSAWIGTGWFVGPRTIITAGHCVYIHSRGGWVRSIEVISGRDGSERPFGSCVTTNFRTVTGWTRDNLRAFDYGAILLPADCRKGDELGWFGYGYYEDDALGDTVVNLSGYPGDKPPGTQWFHSRQVQQLTPTTIVYEIDTAGGQSGAPVWWLTEDGSRIAVGIHTNGDLTGNSATRITQEVFTNIQDWRAQGE